MRKNPSYLKELLFKMQLYRHLHRFSTPSYGLARYGWVRCGGVRCGKVKSGKVWVDCRSHVKNRLVKGLFRESFLVCIYSVQ